MHWLIWPVAKYALPTLLVAGGAIFYKKLSWVPQDNVVEEKIEDMIFDRTGLEVDLSPESLEKDSKDSFEMKKTSKE